MRVLAAVTLLALCTPVSAEEWTTTNKALEGAFLATLAADWSQTRYLVAHRATEMHEVNRVLGKGPSNRAINAYFIGSAILHYEVSDWLTGDKRLAWQGVSLALELSVVHRNTQLGLRIQF